jgi:hypothetical protein
LAFGVVSANERERLRGRALRETVFPCAGALLKSIGLAHSVANGITSPLADDGEFASTHAWLPPRAARPIGSAI